MKVEETTLEFPVHFRTAQHGKQRLHMGRKPKPVVVPEGRVPRVARLLALAIHCEQLIRAGEITDYADLARLSKVTRARATQVMSLLHLAPSIQDEILHLPLVHGGRDPVTERKLRPVVIERDWAKQREAWTSVKRKAKVPG
jgi:hypothetical protein